LLSFTGYLLPWDQLAIWAITVGSNMAKATPLVGSGGPFVDIMKFPGTDIPMIHAGRDARSFLLAGTFVGENALLAVYVLHCVFKSSPPRSEYDPRRTLHAPRDRAMCPRHRGGAVAVRRVHRPRRRGRGAGPQRGLAGERHHRPRRGRRAARRLPRPEVDRPD